MNLIYNLLRNKSNKLKKRTRKYKSRTLDIIMVCILMLQKPTKTNLCSKNSKRILCTFLAFDIADKSMTLIQIRCNTIAIYYIR